ncbi:Shedu anti-phage system protein SduA domain-containing protein [Lysinibacillus xylanilyticus]|uniref:Helicase ATP-binding domain-containing protein n=1 Tax=Lysinibacillus xylanilyticus TaxID=582475 RepID=A0A2M9Q8N8_9BACI|nr:Shedu anti-phage system protein SduA domain-containing protein [Lysinibacillus xylanilyticus]PJO44419.1 hypothetical protein CWD94_06790 [Lysinibacillus xylanilyticus]
MGKKKNIFFEGINTNYSNDRMSLRYYQINAMEAVQKAIENEENEMLIQMAVGTGKTNLGMAISKWFLDNVKSKRVLYLTSMKVMEEYLLGRFNDNLMGYRISLLNKDDEWLDSNIVLSTYQKVNYFDFKGDEFDLIICDEADAISYSILNKVFSLFDTYKIGFIQSDLHFKIDDRNTVNTFYTDKLIYQYTLNDAIQDGYIDKSDYDQIYKDNLELNIYNEINQKIQFFKETLSMDIKDITTLNELVVSLENVNEAIKEYNDIYQNIKKNKLDKEDIVSLGNKKEQLREFNELLYNFDYMNEMKGIKNNSLEKVWQDFLEQNTWIFGYGLNYIFNSPLDNKKLEQVISGYSFNQSGKRIDALMKTRGLINSLCLVEIKTHKTKLLEKQYRNESWGISTELSGAIAQIQKYKYKALKDISNRIEIKSQNGDPTGEVVFNYSPSLVLVIGSLSEFITEKGINEDKLSSFEMFRKSIEGIDIITFDELYDRAKYIIES